MDVYCDGSLTNSRIDDVYESSVGTEFVGRAIVLVPEADVGLVRQTRDGMLAPSGNPSSNNAETFAIESAIELCRRLDLADFVIYSDCQGAVDCFGDNVVWKDRTQMRLPNDFFDKIFRRASYLRRTDGKVERRYPPAPHQVEIFELFNSVDRQFRLSDSPLWQRVSRDAVKHVDALGVTPSPTGSR